MEALFILNTDYLQCMNLLTITRQNMSTMKTLKKKVFLLENKIEHTLVKC